MTILPTDFSKSFSALMTMRCRKEFESFVACLHSVLRFKQVQFNKFNSVYICVLLWELNEEIELYDGTKIHELLSNKHYMTPLYQYQK